MKAYQRTIREKKAQEQRLTLFDDKPEVVDIKQAVVREVSLSTARKIILEYEYLGTMPNAPLFAIGIFYGEFCAGVVIYGSVSPPSVSKSVYFGAPGDVIQLARGACVYWAHKHSASMLIGASLKIARNKGYNLVIAYSDPDAGEVGTVYQSTNWLYCGMTAKRPDYLDGKGKRFVGHMKKGVAKTLEKVERTIKHKYVFVLTRSAKKNIIWPILNYYPKRSAVEVSREIREGSTFEGVGQFHDTALI